MRILRRVAALLFGSGVALACDPSLPEVPELPEFEGEGECWPIEGTTERGSVELGTGEADFEPMPDSMQLYYGNQGGTFLVVHTRMKGLVPGEPEDLYDPSNPRTLFTAILEDGTIVGRPCPTKLGYSPRDEGWFQLRSHSVMEFFVEPAQLFDTELRLVVEIIDSNGAYARNEKRVFAEAPQ